MWPRNWENAARGPGEHGLRNLRAIEGYENFRLAETVAAILRATISAYPHTFRLQQQRTKNPGSLRKKLEGRGKLATISMRKSTNG